MIKIIILLIEIMMQFSLLFFFILFCINNLLHHISEKVIIIIFIIFVSFLMVFLGNLIKIEFENKLQLILNDVHNYMNSVFNFFYLNKFFYINLRQFIHSIISVNSAIFSKIKNHSIL